MIAGALFGIGTRRNIECARAGGASESFVTRQCQQVNIPRLDINREVPGGLGSIDEDKDLFGAGADGFDSVLDVLDGAQDIRGVGEGEQDGVVGAGVDEGLGIDEPLGIAGDDGHVDEITRCVAVEGAEDGVVFDRGGDDMESSGLRAA